MRTLVFIGAVFVIAVLAAVVLACAVAVASDPSIEEDDR